MNGPASLSISQKLPLQPLGALLAFALANTFLLSSASYATEPPAPDAQACNMTEPPTTPVELLDNIRCATARGTFDDADIFTNDETLWKVFGGHTFYKGFQLHPPEGDVSILRLPSTIDEAVLHDEYKYKANIEILRHVIPIHHHRLETSVTLGSATGLRLDFSDIVAIFGADWKMHDNSKTIYEPLHPGIPAPLPKTSIHGYQDIDYTLKTLPDYEAIAVVGFDHSGIMERLEITIYKGD